MELEILKDYISLKIFKLITDNTKYEIFYENCCSDPECGSNYEWVEAVVQMSNREFQNLYKELIQITRDENLIKEVMSPYIEKHALNIHNIFNLS